MEPEKRRKRPMSGIRFIAALLAVLLLAAGTAAEPADGAPVLTATGWTWEAGGTAEFAGSFRVDGDDLTDAVLHLELETDDPENQGTVVFTKINDKSVKIRKRSDTVSTDLSGNGTVNTFTGEWYLPEDSVSLSRATLRFRAETTDGQEIASAELKVGGESEGTANTLGSMLILVRRCSLILLAAAVVFLLCAVIRSTMLNRKKA